MVVPTPTATPLTAAMRGFGKWTNALKNRRTGLSSETGGAAMKSWMSLPAVNAVPAPVTTKARILGDTAASASRSASTAYMASVRAFFFAGRLSTTVRTRPSCSSLTSISMAHAPTSRAERHGLSYDGAMSLADDFATAQTRVKQLSRAPSNDELLELYSLYKQGTIGD